MAARVAIIVGFSAGVSEVEQRATYATLGLGKPSGTVKMRRHIVRVVPARVNDVLATLRADARVAYAEVDQTLPLAFTPNDPLLARQWHHAKIGTPTAWNTTTGLSSIIVAILDSGIDGTHPDLTGRLVGGYNVLTGTAATGDTFGHGTKVAGVVASIGNNGIGGAGVAYGCKLMPVVISDKTGYAKASNIAIGIDWAADHGARVINISINALNGSATVKAAADAARAQGVFVVAAAGNSGTTESYASAAALFAVAATTQSDVLWVGSSRGAFVDVCAPGDQILTTAPGATYSTSTGTSFAAPMVAGLAALLLSYSPDLTLAQLETAITSTVDAGPSGGGAGRINAASAIASVSATPPADVTAPTVTIASAVVATPTLTVTVTATDSESGVAGVKLYLDGVLVGTDLFSPYQFTVNTTPYAAGSHTLVATALDVAGNLGTAAATVVTFTAPVDPPSSTGTCVITSAAVFYGNTLKVTVTASDPTGITKVQCFLDGVYMAQDTTPPHLFTKGVGALITGSRHTVQAKAFNAAGGTMLSAVVAFIK